MGATKDASVKKLENVSGSGERFFRLMFRDVPSFLTRIA